MTKTRQKVRSKQGIRLFDDSADEAEEGDEEAVGYEDSDEDEDEDDYDEKGTSCKVILNRIIVNVLMIVFTRVVD